MKSITTLIEDIYSLFTKPVPFEQKDVEDFGRRLATHVSNRLQEHRGGGSLRLSNLGSPCERKLWYQVHHPDKAIPLTPQTRFKFLYGDILEELVLFLARMAGHSVASEQKTVSINGVKGHIDAIIDGHLVDVKSASPYSFQKFKSHGLEHDDPFAYRVQLGSYLHANQDNPDLKDKDCASFLAVDKTLGHMVLDTHGKTDVEYPLLADAKKRMLAGSLPERTYTAKADGKSGNESLQTICSYCDHRFECWADANGGKGLRVFIASSGPKYLTKVDREPRMLEVDDKGNVVSTIQPGDPF